MDDEGRPMYSLSFDGTGATVNGLSRFNVDANGDVQSVDSYTLTPAQQTDLSSKLNNQADLDAAAAAIYGIPMP